MKIPKEAERIAILKRLIAQRHFRGLWLRGPYLYARRELYEDPQLIKWEDARRIVDQAAAKMPPSSATRAPGTAGARRKAR